MKILVINQPFVPGFCRTQRWAAVTRARVMRPPDWLAYITAVLEEDGHEVRLYDFPARGWRKEQFIQLIRKQRPTLVILDSTTPSIYSDIEYARICKSAGALVAFTGPHATALPEETLVEADGAVDYIIRGEPEETVRELVHAIKYKRDLSTIRGLSFFKAQQTYHNSNRPLMQNLDDLPFPAWHHLDINRYFDGIKLHPFIDIIGGRGCPYQCSFCLWPQVMHGGRYRLRSAVNIVSEMVYDLHVWPQLAKGEFFFEDDTFTVDVNRAEEICKTILELRFPINWSVNARADHGEKELFTTMKRAGCRMLLIGYESANEKVLSLVGKRLSPKAALEKSKLAHNAGLALHGCFVLGLPGETEESMEETVRYALELPLDTVQFSAAVPFPGTSFYNYCVEHNLLKAKSWDQWLDKGEQSCVIDYPGLDCQRVKDKVDEALKRFYFRPTYLATFLFRSRSLRDVYRKTRGAKHFLSYLFKKFSRTNMQQ